MPTTTTRTFFRCLQNVFLPELDRAYSALLEDLHQRGMLESTIVIVTGEFGRTPEINAGGGRDHWPTAFSLAMAGGGITGGRVYGSTDERGGFVKDNPVQVADLAATLYKKLGIDPDKEYVSNIGRPVKIGNNGKPLEFSDGLRLLPSRPRFPDIVDRYAGGDDQGARQRGTLAG